MTEQQRQITRGLALGESVPDLARRLCVTPHTVHKVLSDLYRITGARSQAGLAAWGVAHGIVTLAELQERYGGKAVDRAPSGDSRLEVRA